MKPQSFDYNQLTLGQSETSTRTVTNADINTFAEVSGDKNPVHLDEDYAKNSLFGKKISHGMLLGAFISALIGMRLPGLGTIYLSQNFKFLKPVYIDDVVTTSVTIAALFPEKNRVTIACVCIVNGEKVLEGEALVKKP
jgi:3-hydroxybutyryl-CoA dehydratase